MYCRSYQWTRLQPPPKHKELKAYINPHINGIIIPYKDCAHWQCWEKSRGGCIWPISSHNFKIEPFPAKIKITWQLSRGKFVESIATTMVTCAVTWPIGEERLTRATNRQQSCINDRSRGESRGSHVGVTWRHVLGHMGVVSLELKYTTQKLTYTTVVTPIDSLLWVTSYN